MIVPRTSNHRETTGLVFPRDLSAWQRWQDQRRPYLQRLKPSRDTSNVPAILTYIPQSTPILVAIDGATPSIHAAVESPCTFLDQSGLAILDTRPRHDLMGPDAQVTPIFTADDLAVQLPEIRAVITIGGHLPFGSLAHTIAQRQQVPAYVVQHGLLTPHAPPLPADSTLLAWSENDGEFWQSSRKDIVTHTVGSQLLWHASRESGANQIVDGPPTFLGQLHAAELPRWDLAKVSISFCRSQHAIYRPHPSERDKTSRMIHTTMRAWGISFDGQASMLAKHSGPAVAIFSSGLLEAAVSGRAAYGYHPKPPAWISAFWERYGIAKWGTSPTPAPTQPQLQPAEAIAHIVENSLGHQP